MFNNGVGKFYPFFIDWRRWICAVLCAIKTKCAIYETVGRSWQIYILPLVVEGVEKYSFCPPPIEFLTTPNPRIGKCRFPLPSFCNDTDDSRLTFRYRVGQQWEIGLSTEEFSNWVWPTLVFTEVYLFFFARNNLATSGWCSSKWSLIVSSGTPRLFLYFPSESLTPRLWCNARSRISESKTGEPDEPSRVLAL